MEVLSRIPVATVGVWVSVVGLGCADPESLPCEEREGVSDVLPRVTLQVRESEVSAEVADDEDERSAAWAGRRCELDALLWVPDQVGPANIALCEVVVAVDLAFIREGEVIAMERDRAPCSGPCDACPILDGDVPEVEAVLWLLAGAVEIEVGDPIGGLDDVDLPAVSSDSSGG